MKSFIKQIDIGEWYVCFKENEKNPAYCYLHKDLTVGRFCGSENFFDSEQNAKDCLDLYLYLNNFEFIKEEEMML